MGRGVRLLAQETRDPIGSDRRCFDAPVGITAHLSRRRLWLNLFLTSIAVNAVLGIWALLVDDFGEIQGKILTSSFLVSATMVGLLMNAVPMRERVLWPLPVIAS